MADGKRETTRLPPEYYEIANEYDLEIAEAEDTPGLFEVRTDDGKEVSDDPLSSSDLLKFLVAFEIGYLKARADVEEEGLQAKVPARARSNARKVGR